MDVQKVRLADIFFIAPVLMYASTQKQLSDSMRLTILGIGVATLIYNAHNYIKAK
jgi:ABC-type enterobactin transport system permease subunit